MIKIDTGYSNTNALRDLLPGQSAKSVAYNVLYHRSECGEYLAIFNNTNMKIHPWVTTDEGMDIEIIICDLKVVMV